uniref:Uncharacterized protein n=1 Tax=Vespula pensylvanica TaxID=30213 RepID=A0A834NC31_VESPE|nr:hypothetical protein H0235_015309 [Vespula pensylvanica]
MVLGIHTYVDRHGAVAFAGSPAQSFVLIQSRIMKPVKCEALNRQDETSTMSTTTTMTTNEYEDDDEDEDEDEDEDDEKEEKKKERKR